MVVPSLTSYYIDVGSKTIVWGNGTSIRTATLNISGLSVNLVLGPSMNVTHTAFSYHGQYLAISCSTCNNGYIQIRAQTGLSVMPSEY